MKKFMQIFIVIVFVLLINKVTFAQFAVNPFEFTVDDGISYRYTGIRFGGVMIGNFEDKRLNVKNVSGTTVVISRIEIITVDLLEYQGVFTLPNNETSMTPITLQPGKSFEIIIRFSPHSLYHLDYNLHAALTLYHSGGNDFYNGTYLNIILIGDAFPSGEPGIKVTPGNIDFGNLDIGSIAERYARITNVGDVPLVIYSITTNGHLYGRYSYLSFPNGETTITIPAGGYYDLLIRACPTSVTPFDFIDYDGVGFLTNARQHGGLSTHLIAGRSGIKISVESTGWLLNFGQVTIGTSLALPVTITNNSDYPLVLSSIGIQRGNENWQTPGMDISGARFTLLNNETALTIRRGKSYKIIVRFSPINFFRDGYRAWLVFTDNVTGQVNSVSLRGYGTFDNNLASFHLLQNYPNPFNPTTTIQYSIPRDEFVKLTVYDITGKVVKELVNRHLVEGKYSVEFNGSSYSSGTYYYKLEAGEYKKIQKMMLIK
jgi:hypothetical protein